MTRIVTDSTAGLPAAVAQHYAIPIIPQVIVFGAESYLEGVQIDVATFLRRLTTSTTMPKTAAPPPQLFADVFRRLVPGDEPILCIHPSTELSGTVRSAMVAAQDIPAADIRVIDTRTIAGNLATMVTLAAGWAAGGAGADEIENRLRRVLIPSARTYFLVNTLEYLVRGGRIGGAAGMLGSVLQVKPILALRNGRVEQFERERTHKRALARLKQLVMEEIPPDGGRYLTVMHAGNPEPAQMLAAEFAALYGASELPVLELPPAIVTHAGPGVLAVGFFTETDIA